MKYLFIVILLINCIPLGIFFGLELAVIYDEYKTERFSAIQAQFLADKRKMVDESTNLDTLRSESQKILESYKQVSEKAERGEKLTGRLTRFIAIFSLANIAICLIGIGIMSLLKRFQKQKYTEPEEKL